MPQLHARRDQYTLALAEAIRELDAREPRQNPFEALAAATRLADKVAPKTSLLVRVRPRATVRDSRLSRLAVTER